MLKFSTWGWTTCVPSWKQPAVVSPTRCQPSTDRSNLSQVHFISLYTLFMSSFVLFESGELFRSIPLGNLYFICFFSAVNRGRTQSLSRRSRGSSTSGGESGPDSDTSGGETGESGEDTEGTGLDDDLSLSEFQKKSTKGKGKRKSPQVLTTDMFHQYPFIRLFATGPRNMDHNRHKFYCRLCKRNFSLKTKGIGEVKKHFRSRKHFTADQQYRLQNFLPVYGKDCKEITGSSLEHLRASSSSSASLNPPSLDAKRPLVGQFVIPTEDLDPDSPEVLRCQLTLYKDFISRGAPVDLLPTLWGSLATVSHHPTMTSNFNWDSARVFVSISSMFAVLFIILYS